MKLVTTHILKDPYLSNIEDGDIVHKHDTFDQSDIDNLLSRATPKYFINDHFTSGKFDGINFFGLPLYAEKEARRFNQQCLLSDDLQTLHCFNFIVNKKQINRYLCIKLVELFKLENFDYTWSGIDYSYDCSGIIKELDQLSKDSPLSQEQRKFILEPINLEKKFITHDKQIIASGVSIVNYGTNSWTWNNGLNNVFQSSACSLITESIRFQKASCFTEKTLYAVLGLTFPIWVGGYEQAKEWTRLGFDTFDDIIDHSYQSHSTLIERCYYAIANNIDLLSNKAKIHELRLQNKHRLLKNRDFLLMDGLSRFVDQQIAQFPADLQQIMPDIVKYFRDLNQ